MQNRTHSLSAKFHLRSLEQDEHDNVKKNPIYSQQDVGVIVPSM